MVRCFKRMENDLVSTRIEIVPVAIVFMESLIYNCPNYLFSPESYVEPSAISWSTSWLSWTTRQGPVA